MKNWFTTEQIDTDTFAISEYAHPEETHCYLLLGTERAVLIDTGLGISDISSVVRTLTSFPITVLTTHAHWDHIGGHRHFDTFAVHEAEYAWLAEKFPLPLSAVKTNLMQGALPTEFDPDTYQMFKGEPSFLLHDGDTFDLGNRTLQVIHTPGHSPGHCCFYEAERGYLYTGDLIYSGRLDAFYPTTDPLAFYDSVKKINALAIKRLLPAHHRLDLPLDILPRIEAAFSSLCVQGRLHHGSGEFPFEDFSIKL